MTPAELFKLFFNQDFRWADMVDAERRKGNPQWEVGKKFLNGPWSKWFAAINEEVATAGNNPDAFVNRWLTIAHEQLFPAATRAGFPAESFIIPDITIHETVGASMSSFLDVLESANPLVTLINPGAGMALSTALKANEVLAQAKNGDPKALGKIAAVKAKADSGDPEAQVAVEEMKSISKAQDDKAASFLRRVVRDHRKRGRGWLNIVGHDPYTFVGADYTNPFPKVPYSSIPNLGNPPPPTARASRGTSAGSNALSAFIRGMKVQYPGKLGETKNNPMGTNDKIYPAWDKYYPGLLAFQRSQSSQSHPRSSPVATSTRPPIRNQSRPPVRNQPRASTPIRPPAGVTASNITPGTVSSDGKYVWNGKNWVRPGAAPAQTPATAQNPYGYPPGYVDPYAQYYPPGYDPYAQYGYPQSPYPMDPYGLYGGFPAQPAYDPYSDPYAQALAQQQALAYAQYGQQAGVPSNPNNMVWDEATQSFYSNQVNQRYDEATGYFVPCVEYNPYNEYMVSGTKRVPDTGFFGRMYNKGLRGR